MKLWGLLLGLATSFSLSFGLSGCQKSSSEPNSLVAFQDALLEIGQQCEMGIVIIDAGMNESEAEVHENDAQCHRIGSGFIYSSDGYIVTTDGVCGTGDVMTVIMQDNQNFSATVIGSDFETNIAVLKIDRRDLSAIPLYNGNVQPGCLGIMIGNTYYSQGLTCALGTIGQTWIGGGDFLDNKLYSISVAPMEVSSGTPVVDIHGSLVGIAEGHMDGQEAIWTVIPAVTIREVADRLIENGQIERGWLGIISDPICPEHEIEALVYAWKGKGAVVSSIVPDSPASLAGLHAGDVIRGFNDQSVVCISDLRRKLTPLPQGTKTILEISRNGEDMTIELNLDKLNCEPDRKRRSLSRSV